MAFTPVTNGGGTVGPQGLKVVWGTFTNGAGDSGGNIETGFAAILDVSITPTSHFNTAYPKFTWTASDGTVAIVTEDNMDANWMAWGIGEG